jgi:enoyl-[acyl-carrier protein] reductase II
MSLRTPICDLFGIDHPVFLAGMGGVAYAEVCAAVSEAGGFGTLGMAGFPPELIRAQMREVRRRTSRPFGVDLLAALPEQIDAAIDVILDEGASAFIAGLGVPESVVDRCHRRSVKVMVLCGKVSHAIHAEAAGCDAVVAQGTEAGGHTGSVGGMALVPQTVDAVRIPVLAAGAIVDGRGLAAALAFGAQGAWIGTRFIASHEARAAALYKQRIVEAGSADTRVTRCYSGKPMRVLQNRYVDEWEKRTGDLQPFPLQLMRSASEGLLAFSDDGKVDAARSCMPAGQGVGGIDDILPVAEIMQRLLHDARATIERLATLTSTKHSGTASARS